MTRNCDIPTGAVAIFGLLFTLYLLVFNGLFTSIDELSLYTRAESLVQQGNLDTPQLAFSAFHNRVGEEEAGFSLVAAPFYWLAQQSHRLNNIHLVMLLNPLLTAATGALVYATTRMLGYSQTGSAVGALAFGLTTLAWPYARTLYREPLVGLGWSLGLLCLVVWRYRGRAAWAMVGGMILAMTLAVKVAAMAGVPFIFLATAAGMRDRRQLRRLAVLLAVVAAFLALLFVVIFAWRHGSHSLLDALSQWTLIVGLKRTYGQLLSPGRGLVFYMPVVILAMLGLVLMGRRHPAVALAAALPLLTTVVAYSCYATWYGGQSWGPRFLVPTVPLVMSGMAPLWDAIRLRWQRTLALVVLVLSLIIQLGVVTADWWPGYEALFKTGPTPEDNVGLQLSSLALSPPLAQLRAWRPDNLDLLWLHPDLTGAMVFSPALGLGLMAAGAISGVSWWLCRRKGWPVGVLLLPPAAALAMLLWWGPEATPGFPGLPADQGRALAEWAAGEGNNRYTLVTMSNEFHVYFYLGFLKGDFVHHWLSPNQTADFEPILAQAKGDRLILVMDRVHIDPAFSGKELEWWLNEQLFRVCGEWVGDYELVSYATMPADGWLWQEVDYAFGDSFALTAFATSQGQLRRGETLGLQTRICRIGPVPDYHQLFIHLQAPGRQISGHDGPIRYGGTQAVPWEKGDCLVGRRAIHIPAEAQPGVYDIIVGFDTPGGLLAVKGVQTGASTSGYAILGRVMITPKVVAQ